MSERDPVGSGGPRTLAARLAAGGRAAYETAYAEGAEADRYLRLFERPSSAAAPRRGPVPEEVSLARNL